MSPSNCPPTPTPPQPNPIPSTEAELHDIREFKEAAQEALKLEDRARRFHPRLARFYMWAQTQATVWLACRVPCGGCRVGRG